LRRFFSIVSGTAGNFFGAFAFVALIKNNKESSYGSHFRIQEIMSINLPYFLPFWGHFDSLTIEKTDG
jgi:hypothetical protein